MINQKLQPLTKFRRLGLWLGVLTKNNELMVASSGKTVSEVLLNAKKSGFEGKISLIKSAHQYALLAPNVI